MSEKVYFSDLFEKMSSFSKGIRREEGPVFKHFEAEWDGGLGIEKDGNFIQLCLKKLRIISLV